jgi:hypothetical protein
MNRKGNSIWFIGMVGVGLAMAGLSSLVGAQEPARALRLSYIDGQVRLSQNGQVLAEQATANAPLLEGMNLTSADSGKAEIQFEDGSVARLAPDSSLTIQVLRGSGAAAKAEISVDSGLAYFEIQGGEQAGSIAVRFAGNLATVGGFTVFRVDMDNPPGQLAVFSGNLHLQNDAGTQPADLHGGENIALNGADPSQYNLSESVEANSWDAWNSDRDQALTAEVTNQTGIASNYSESGNPAWNDLDANGNWYNVPGQGYVWSPYEASDTSFDPYGNGSWMWTPGFGYIWVSGYPWGYLPFSCGRWSWYDNFGWGWMPGTGACRSWWSIGIYGGPNFGYLPGNYHRIVRPVLPHRPVGGGPIPVVSIRRPQIVAQAPLPRRDKETPVLIGGSALAAVRAHPDSGRADGVRVIYGTQSPRQEGGQHERPGYGNPAAEHGVNGQNNAQQGHGSTRPQWTPPGGSPGANAHSNNEPANHPGAGSSQSSGAVHPSNSGGSNSGGSHPSNSGGGNSGSGSHPGSGSGGNSGGGGGSHSGGGNSGSSNNNNGPHH